MIQILTRNSDALVIRWGSCALHSRGKKNEASADRLQAVAQGKDVGAEIHSKVLEETPVLEIDRFNLWYGSKQVIHNISMPIMLKERESSPLRDTKRFASHQR